LIHSQSPQRHMPRDPVCNRPGDRHKYRIDQQIESGRNVGEYLKNSLHQRSLLRARPLALSTREIMTRRQRQFRELQSATQSNKYVYCCVAPAVLLVPL
jgi:hypothetical protein